MPIPDHCREEVSVDLITGLLLTSRGHNALTVFVDRLSKRILLVPCQDTLTAEGFADMFFNHVYRQFGMPNAITSDRGPQADNNLWRNLCEHPHTPLTLLKPAIGNSGVPIDERSAWLEQDITWAKQAQPLHSRNKNAMLTWRGGTPLSKRGRRYCCLLRT
jgi:hypothetical protein